MTAYNLPETPNQEVTLTADGIDYFFTLRTFRNLLYCTIRDYDGNILISNIRCTNNGWLLPFDHTRIGGNFRFEDKEWHYPDYKRFGKTTTLCYYNSVEETE